MNEDILRTYRRLSQELKDAFNFWKEVEDNYISMKFGITKENVQTAYENYMRKSKEYEQFKIKHELGE